MREAFLDLKMSRKTLAIIDQVNEILLRYARQGYRLTGRQIYYRFIALDLFPDDWIDTEWNIKNKLDPNTKNTIKNYKRLLDIINNGRLSGRVDWDRILDNTREVTRWQHWSSPSEALRSTAKYYEIDKWKGQQHYVLAMVEKDAAETYIRPVCSREDIEFFSSRGYSSSTALYDLGKYLRGIRDRDGREVHVLYIGDHDPSGMDMPRYVKERLELFSEGEIDVVRLALNMDQVVQYQPPPNPAKKTDSRAAGYIAEHGDDSYELDALEPAVLSQILTDAIRSYRNEDLYREREGQEAQEREAIQEYADQWDREHSDDNEDEDPWDDYDPESR